MNPMLFGLVVVLLGLGSQSARADVPWVGLPEHGEYQALSKEDRSLYVHGLQILTTKLAELHAKKFKYPRKRKPAAQTIHCDYAGHLLQIPESGVCPAPPPCPNSPGLVQCWADLFGENVCVAPGPNTDVRCRENARPASVIAERYRKDPAAWGKLQAQLGEYCDSGLESDSCRVVRDQVHEINELVGYGTPPPADMIVGRDDAGRGRRTTVPARARGPRGQTEIGGSGTRVEKEETADRAPVAQVLGADAEPEPAAPEAPSEATSASACDTGQMLVTIECDPTVGAESVLSPSEAHQIFCTRKKITAEEERILGARMARMSSCLKKLPTSVSTTTNNRYEFMRAQHLREVHQKISNAVKACIGEVKAGRAPLAEAASNRPALVRSSDGMLSLSATANSPKGWRFHEMWVGGVLMTEKLSLCSLRLSGFPSGVVQEDFTKAAPGTR